MLYESLNEKVPPAITLGTSGARRIYCAFLNPLKKNISAFLYLESLFALY